jgi:hypothetical protein
MLQCTKLPYFTNVEFIIMSDLGVLSLRRTHLERLDLIQDILLQGISTTAEVCPCKTGLVAKEEQISAS